MAGSFGVNCELDRRIVDKDGHLVKNGEHNQDGKCCVVGLLHVAKVKFADHGTTGKCSVCGANFIYGEVWRHEPTGEHIHQGHICSEKYGMLMDRLELGRLKQAAATAIVKAQNSEARQSFLSANPGLEAALKTDHYIVKDIAARFQSYCSLSPRQVELVFKLANEAANPKPEEPKVPAPTGRLRFKGEVVSVKDHESAYGVTMKMVVKVKAEGGIWLAWGTVPADINGEGLRGKTVELTGTLSQGRDPHFAFFKRPSHASVIAS